MSDEKPKRGEGLAASTLPRLFPPEAALLELAEKAAKRPWYVNFSEQTDENGNGPGGFSIGPYEDDLADCFAFSATFDATCPPEELENTFEFIVAACNQAPTMLATINELREALHNLVEQVRNNVCPARQLTGSRIFGEAERLLKEKQL